MDLDATLDTAQGSSAQPLVATSSSSSSIRTSARVRAARERLEQQQQQQQQQIETQPLTTDQTTTNNLTNRRGKKTVPSASTNSSSIARPRRSLATQPLTINEPVSDRKGKKRALPSDDELSSEDEDEEEGENKDTQPNPPSRVRQPPPKRLKTSASSYSLRTRAKKAMPAEETPKKASSSNDAGPSRNQDEDVEMAFQSDAPPEEIQVKTEESSSLPKPDPDAPSTSTLPVLMSTDTNESNNTNANPTDTIVAETSSSDPSSSVEPPPVPASADPEPIPESSASPDPIPVPAEPPLSSLMDGDFQFGAYMASLGPRLKTLLNNIKADADPTVRLLALQDLSEILSMSTEDNLNGYFSQDSFVKELVRIMGGKSTDNENENEENNDGDEGDSDEGDENSPNERNNDAIANTNANAEPATNAEGASGDNAVEASRGDNTTEAVNAPEGTTAEVTAPASTAQEATTSEPAPAASEQTAPEPNVVEQNVPAPAPVPAPAVPEQIAPEPIVVDQVAPEAIVVDQIAPEQAVPATVVPEQPVLVADQPSPEQVPPEQAPTEPVPSEQAPPEQATAEPAPPEQAPPEPVMQGQLAVEQAVPVSVPIDIDPVAMGFGLGMGMDMGMGIDPEDEDAALAAALAMSAGDAGIDLSAFGGGIAQPEENLEEQLLACRCLANLMEAMPGSAHTLVYHGAVPVLCSKLQQITFIDLAEQTISTLEKLSEEYPSAIVRENGLSALLNYLDFFSTHVQRTALQAAANCCRNMSSDSYPMIKDVFPTIRNVLTYSDQRLVELASMCVIRTIESFARSLPNELEALIKGDLVRSINALLVPQSAGGGAGASQMITPNTATLFLRSLSSAAKSSPNITVTLLESGIENTLYAFLTGVLPPNHAQQEELEGNLAGVEGEVGMGGQGVGSGVVDMAVMQNLAGRPKDQVEEALGLISELMPPLPRDGVFDPRGYTEKSVSRAIKAKVKEAKASSRPTAPAASTSTGDATTTESTSNEVPIKTELAPQEVEMVNMLLVPESDMATPATPANDLTTSEAGQDVVMQIDAPVEPAAENVEMQDAETVQATQDTPATENPAAPEALTFNPALTNAEGEPLMAMMTDDADLPVPTPSGSQDQASGDSSQPNAPEVPAEVIAAVAGSGSSHRHRHGESSSTHARLQLLREKPAVVSRFLYLIVPVLFDVYSASVTLQVRMRCFTGILKATSFVEGVGMETLYRNVPVASFIGSILTSRDNPLLVTNALQLVELLLIKSPSVFRNSLRKEGVLHEVSTISKIELKVKAKPTPAEGGENGEGTNEDGSAPPPPRKTSSIPSDPQDAYVLRARLIKVKYLTGGSDVGGDPVFDSLKAMIKILTDPEADEEQLGGTLKDIAKLFGSSVVAISSFELLKSGLVDGLLDFATATGRKVDIEKRKDLFLDAFSARSGYATPSSQSPMAVLVKRLQESLTRMETFDVVTTSPGSMEDAKRSSMALISRTLRLKLVAEDQSEVPKSCQNLMVSIHAIAPFSALDEYLKPRIAGVLPFRPELTPGLLQALAGTGLPSSALAQSVLSRIAGRPAGSTVGAFGSLFGALTGNSSSSLTANTSSLPPFTSSSTSSPIPIPSRRRTTGTGSGEQASSSEPAIAPETSTSEGTGISRRRSLRLRGQPPESVDASTTATAPVINEPAASTSAPVSSSTSPSIQNPSALASSLLHQLLVDDAEMDDGLDDEIGEDIDQHVPERAYNLAFDAAGRDLMASTPQGTRIATPLPGSTPGGAETPIAALAAANAAKKPSYADAANAAIEKATDFHLEFRLEGALLPMEMTVYGACHQYEARRSSDGQPNPHAVWNGNYTITYRKIPGKRPVQEATKDDALMETDIVAGLAPDSPSSKILRLLRVLYRLNSEGVEHVDSNMKIVTIPDAAFINNKLTAKLARQLEEIMILASNCLPEWAMDLPQGFGFLFPFSTRYLFLQSTSFGYARLLNRVISQSPREVANNSRREGLEQYGRLQRRKVEVPRDSPMQVALKVFDLFGPSSSILDVHFQGEVGTGLGPTLEFFASVCREFAWRELKLWRDTDTTLPGKYVHHPLGLFPAPMLNEVVDGPGATERDRRRIRLYRLLGQFVARALLDSRIIDISFNKIFVKLILGDHIPLTVSSVKLIDPTLGNSLATLQQFAKLKKAIDTDETLKKGEKNKRIANLEVNGAKLEDMCLDFTAPGYDDLELKPNGKNITVTAKNVEEYIELVIDAILGRGTRPAVDAFKNGFSTVFSVADLRTFSAEELIMMFGNSDEDWSAETLSEAVKADHGFNVESKAIRDLIDIMISYDKNGRRDFLQFITGSPKLPIGGFKALNPQLTVVRKPHEAPLTPDDYLPSVMTCAHYLKLPSYSSRDVMEKKLMIAMREGTGSFHLS